MKNSQKGFVVPFLILIIAVMVIAEAFYIYNLNRSETLAQKVANDALPTDIGTMFLSNANDQTGTFPTINSVSPQTFYITGGSSMSNALVTITGTNFSKVKVHLLNPATGANVTTD